MIIFYYLLLTIPLSTNQDLSKDVSEFVVGSVTLQFVVIFKNSPQFEIFPAEIQGVAIDLKYKILSYFIPLKIFNHSKLRNLYQ